MRKYCLLLAALLLLCGCGKKDPQSGSSLSTASAESAADAVWSETSMTEAEPASKAAPVSETEAAPETEAEPETEPEPVTETEPETETEPPREFTDEDFNFYLDGFGEQVPDRINVCFYPENRDGNGAADPNIRVWDSYLITNETEIRDICARILTSEYYDAELYGRTLDSMAVEWLAHNAVNSFYDNERTRHVDFNRADEGVTYMEFWQRALREYTAEN